MMHQADTAQRRGTGNEEGSALVIALLAVVMMTILGLVLMEVLRGGAIQAATSEASIQAEAIAQKGLDDTLAQIRGAVAYGETLGGNDYRSKIVNVQEQLTAILPNIDKHVGSDPDHPSDNDGEVVSARKGTYRIDIVSAQTMSNPEAEGKPITYPDFPFVRKFDIKSRGMVEGNPDKLVSKQMTVYVSTINPVFRYPVSSTGDLKLNGAPYVIGDILVKAGNVHVRDEALFIGNSRSKYGVKTELPAIRGFIRVDGDGIDGEPLKYNLSQSNGSTENVPIADSNDKLEPSYFAPQYFPLEDPTLDSDVAVDIEGYVHDKTVTRTNSTLATMLGGFEEPDPSMLDLTLFYNLNKSTLFNNQWVTVQGGVLVKNTASPTAQSDLFVNNGVLAMADASTNLTIQRGSLYVRTPDRNLIAADLRGKLTLDSGQFMAVDGNVILNDGFEFPQGSMYIKGDLKIIGDIPRLQGTVYVDGNVELKEMRSINKMRTGDTAQIPLIVIASGEIVLGNNTNEGDEEIRAFFYSKKSMRLYGVMSKLNLTGGIHGGTGVELNAVRGDITNGIGSPVNAYSGSPAWSGAVPDVQLDKPVNSSRLHIVYDNNLFDLPPDGIPTTKAFNVFVKDIQFSQ